MSVWKVLGLLQSDSIATRKSGFVPQISLSRPELSQWFMGLPQVLLFNSQQEGKSETLRANACEVTWAFYLSFPLISH